MIPMNCIFPPELDEKKLLAYLDGVADHETESHLEQCEYCREKAKALAVLQKRLAARLYRIDCPSPMELGEFHLRMVPAAQALVIAQHVRECPHCTRELAQLKDFLSQTRNEDLLGKAKILIAKLIGTTPSEGSPSMPSPVALRGEAKGPIVLEADGIVITLDIQTAAQGQASVLGQVAADDQNRWTGALVELSRVDAPTITIALDDLGAFRYEEVRPGSIQITITSSDGIILQIPNIEITF
jgi:hypothetical protein